jgi:hypothetical protein
VEARLGERAQRVEHGVRLLGHHRVATIGEIDDARFA